LNQLDPKSTILFGVDGSTTSLSLVNGNWYVDASFTFEFDPHIIAYNFFNTTSDTTINLVLGYTNFVYTPSQSMPNLSLFSV
jgi:hypothetical protein